MSILELTPHAPHPFFDVVDDSLFVAGRSIVDVAAEAGQTPFYVYAARHMTERVGLLRDLFSNDVRLHYSIKANPMPAVVQHMAKLVDGIDVASSGELKLALQTGVGPRRISFAGPGKRLQELRDAVDAHVVINIESETELDRLMTLSRLNDHRPRIAVRINPAFELRGSGMKMGGGAKPFGIDADRVPDLLRRMRRLPIEFVGFHIFSGSQNLKAASIVEAQEQAIALAIELADFAPSPVQAVSIGGGLGIPYFPGDQPVDLEPIGTAFRKLAASCRQRLGADLVVELGRYLVGEAGLYVSTVVDRKISRGTVFLVTDGGLHHHLAASGNFGQVLRKNYPVLIGNRVRGQERECVNVVGPLCTPLDIIAHQADLTKAGVGDLVVVLQSGAYGFTASPIGFLSHPPPVELLI